MERSFTAEELSGSYFNPGDAAIQEDSRFIAALEEWSACTRDAGYDYAHPDDAEDDIAERLDEVTGGAEIDSLTGSDAEALAVLQSEEQTIGTAALACEEEHIVPAEEEIEAEIYGAPQN